MSFRDVWTRQIIVNQNSRDQPRDPRPGNVCGFWQEHAELTLGPVIGLRHQIKAPRRT
jgi:hypothetical protein